MVTVLKVRKKPVEVEAMLFDGLNRQEIGIWSDYKVSNYSAGLLVVETLEGHMIADKGDYIIRGIKGEFYPCKPDIFRDSYEVL